MSNQFSALAPNLLGKLVDPRCKLGIGDKCRAHAHERPDEAAVAAASRNSLSSAP